MQGKQLEKSMYNKKLDGVCAGIAHYLDIDPTVIRLVMVLFTLGGGAGILLYLIAAIIMPRSTEF
ncbi:MAG: PspC domain-containing protein [Erysipelotrichaceae bacterium]|nr:PspC domain-containing protein [Erysipelotrichaceae bacterium]